MALVARLSAAAFHSLGFQKTHVRAKWLAFQVQSQNLQDFQGFWCYFSVLRAIAIAHDPRSSEPACHVGAADQRCKAALLPLASHWLHAPYFCPHCSCHLFSFWFGCPQPCLAFLCHLFLALVSFLLLFPAGQSFFFFLRFFVLCWQRCQMDLVVVENRGD